ncbi:MAG: hypothetical protein ACSNEK_03270 [Parachlamydiaceae bacterium]
MSATTGFSFEVGVEGDIDLKNPGGKQVFSARNSINDFNPMFINKNPHRCLRRRSQYSLK